LARWAREGLSTSTEQARFEALVSGAHDARLLPAEAAIQAALEEKEAEMRLRPGGAGRALLLDRIRLLRLKVARQGADALPECGGRFRREVIAWAEHIASLHGARVVVGEERLHTEGVHAWSAGPLASDAGRRFVSVSPDLSALQRLHSLAHEGHHLADGDYRRAETALALLYGRAGFALANALTEGYTELRARESMARVLAGSALVGGDPAGRQLRWAIAASDLSLRLPAANRSLAKHFRDQPYEPFVRLVHALTEAPGGRRALDALVARGDVAPLLAVAGASRLGDLAVVLQARR
jgi:hypothetical protein